MQQLPERFDIRMDGGITTKKILYVFGRQINKPNGKPRYFRTKEDALKFGEKLIKANRKHIGE
jgi:hypothetical protein